MTPDPSEGPRARRSDGPAQEPMFRSHQPGLQLPSPCPKTNRNRSPPGSSSPRPNPLCISKAAMDPAGTGSCAPDHHHNGEASNPHTLYSTDPEAKKDASEHGRSQAKTGYRLQPIEADFREEAVEGARKRKNQYRWRRVIRNFTPSYAEAFPLFYYR